MFIRVLKTVLGKWATPACDTVDRRNAGQVAKTQSSHAQTREVQTLHSRDYVFH